VLAGASPAVLPKSSGTLLSRSLARLAVRHEKLNNR
jgi:hypothetical protein